MENNLYSIFLRTIRVYWLEMQPLGGGKKCVVFSLALISRL